MTRNEPVVFHFRLGRGKETNPKTGATVVFLPEKMRFGIALCCEKDRYCKQFGIKIATHRAEIDRNIATKNSRFNYAPTYDGPTEYNDLKNTARVWVRAAAVMVGNPIAESQEGS